MNLLITGDAGYIGSVLVPMLLQSGHLNGLPAGSIPSKSFHNADAQEAIRRAQVIIHSVKQRMGTHP